MAVPQYCDEVLVTLNNVNPPEIFPFPSRRIFLTKENPIMNIGRTSKRNSSLEAAKNNAWFDSAVMSRDHAQLRLDVDKQKVYIKDIGSLHGTFHNDTRLSRNVPCQLKNGDSLQFGIEIDRGAERYPPCVMETHLEFGFASPQDRPKVFRVPDDTDVEDSGSDADESIRNSTKIARRIVIPTWATPTHRAIDLTEGEQYPLSNIREEGVASNVLPIAEGPKCVDLTRDDEEMENPDQPPQAFNAPWLLPLERPVEEDGLSQDILTQASFGDGSERSSVHSGSEPGSRLGSDSGSELGSELDLGSDLGSELGSDSGSVAPSSFRNSVFGESDDENMDEREEWEGVQDELEEDEFHEYDEFEGLNDTCAPLAEPEPMNQDGQVEMPVTSFPLFLADARPAMGGIVERSQERADVLDFTDARNKLPPIVGNSEAPLPIPSLPSIAAATYPAPCLSQAVSSRISAQALGDKTGKHEYFAAREENRLLFRGDGFKGLKGDEATASGSIGVCPPELPPFSIDQQVSNVEERMDYELLASIPAVNMPVPALMADEKPKPLENNRPSAFDADSAFEFEQMCLQAKKTLDAQPKAADTHTAESTLPSGAAELSDRTDTIVGQKVTVEKALPEARHTPNAVKRKAGEISKLTPTEELLASTTAAQDEARPTPKARPHAPRRQHRHAVSSEMANFDMRPNKRFRRVAEAFGYVALGGVAVMSALIATAPTL